MQARRDHWKWRLACLTFNAMAFSRAMARFQGTWPVILSPGISEANDRGAQQMLKPTALRRPTNGGHARRRYLAVAQGLEAPRRLSQAGETSELMRKGQRRVVPIDWHKPYRSNRWAWGTKKQERNERILLTSCQMARWANRGGSVGLHPIRMLRLLSLARLAPMQSPGYEQRGKERGDVWSSDIDA